MKIMQGEETSDLVDTVKRTPIPLRQKVSLALLGLVMLGSGFGLGISMTFNHLKDRLRPPGPVPFVMDHLERMAKEYELTPEQKTQVKPALEKFHESFQEMWNESQQTMSLARDNLVAELKQLLTTEQFDQWSKDMQEREKRHIRRGFSGRRGDRRDRDRGDSPRDGGGPPRGWDPNGRPNPGRPPGPHQPPWERNDDPNR